MLAGVMKKDIDNNKIGAILDAQYVFFSWQRGFVE